MSMGRGGVFGNPDQFMGGGLFGRRKSPLERTNDMAQQFMPQIAPETQGAIDQYAAMPTQRRGGLFGGDIAGGLGDLAGGLARAQAYMDGNWDAAQSIVTKSDLQRKAELMAAQAEAERRAKFDDWRQQYDYERSNPKPSTNDTVADYNFMTQTLGKDAADKWLERRSDPMINMTLPNGQFYSGPQSGLEAAIKAGGQGATNNPPIGSVIPDPRKAGGANGSSVGQPFRR